MRTARIAVAIFFFANGFIFANWVGRVPAFKDKHSNAHTVQRATVSISLAHSDQP